MKFKITLVLAIFSAISLTNNSTNAIPNSTNKNNNNNINLNASNQNDNMEIETSNQNNDKNQDDNKMNLDKINQTNDKNQDDNKMNLDKINQNEDKNQDDNKMNLDKTNQNDDNNIKINSSNKKNDILNPNSSNLRPSQKLAFQFNFLVKDQDAQNLDNKYIPAMTYSSNTNFYTYCNVLYDHLYTDISKDEGKFHFLNEMLNKNSFLYKDYVNKNYKLDNLIIKKNSNSFTNQNNGLNKKFKFDLKLTNKSMSPKSFLFSTYQNNNNNELNLEQFYDILQMSTKQNSDIIYKFLDSSCLNIEDQNLKNQIKSCRFENVILFQMFNLMLENFGYITNLMKNIYDQKIPSICQSDIIYKEMCNKYLIWNDENYPKINKYKNFINAILEIFSVLMHKCLHHFNDMFMCVKNQKKINKNSSNADIINAFNNTAIPLETQSSLLFNLWECGSFLRNMFYHIFSLENCLMDINKNNPNFNLLNQNDVDVISNIFVQLNNFTQTFTKFFIQIDLNTEKLNCSEKYIDEIKKNIFTFYGKIKVISNDQNKRKYFQNNTEEIDKQEQDKEKRMFIKLYYELINQLMKKNKSSLIHSDKWSPEQLENFKKINIIQRLIRKQEDIKEFCKIYNTYYNPYMSAYIKQKIIVNKLVEYIFKNKSQLKEIYHNILFCRYNTFDIDKYSTKINRSDYMSFEKLLEKFKLNQNSFNNNKNNQNLSNYSKVLTNLLKNQKIDSNINHTNLFDDRCLNLDRYLNSFINTIADDKFSFKPEHDVKIDAYIKKLFPNIDKIMLQKLKRHLILMIANVVVFNIFSCFSKVGLDEIACYYKIRDKFPKVLMGFKGELYDNVNLDDIENMYFNADYNSLSDFHKRCMFQYNRDLLHSIFQSYYFNIDSSEFNTMILNKNEQDARSYHQTTFDGFTSIVTSKKYFDIDKFNFNLIKSNKENDYDITENVNNFNFSYFKSADDVLYRQIYIYLAEYLHRLVNCKKESTEFVTNFFKTLMQNETNNNSDYYNTNNDKSYNLIRPTDLKLSENDQFNPVYKNDLQIQKVEKWLAESSKYVDLDKVSKYITDKLINPYNQTDYSQYSYINKKENDNGEYESRNGVMGRMEQLLSNINSMFKKNNGK